MLIVYLQPLKEYVRKLHPDNSGVLKSYSMPWHELYYQSYLGVIFKHNQRFIPTEIVRGAAYLDLARIFLLLRFSLRILFLRHWKLNASLASFEI